MNSLLILCFAAQSNSFAKNDIDAIQVEIIHFNNDNPKGKLKIRFIRNKNKSDTTINQKAFIFSHNE